MIIMLLTIVMDLLSSCLTLSDFAQKNNDDFPISSCGFDMDSSQKWRDQRRTLVILSLFCVFARGVLVLLFNVGLFINVAMIYKKQGKPKKVAPVVSESKTNQEDLWIPYPGPREEDQTQSEDHPDVLLGQGQGHGQATHYQAPHLHAQEHRGDGHHYEAPLGRGVDRHHQDPDHRGYRDVYHNQLSNRKEEQDNRQTGRRAPSFADRLKEADTNFSNKVGF